MKLLFVHAHPDDEAIWTGGLAAQAARAGAEVTVVTCTLGELGEVIGEPYQGLVAQRSDQLGGFRIAELTRSLRALGANGPDHQPLFLGGAGRWRDSGMAGAASNADPRAFIHSGAAAVAQLQELLERLQPDVVITYDADGGYGHPDHIRAHDIVVAACADRYATLWAVTDQARLEAGLQAITAIPPQWLQAGVGDIAAADAEYEVALDEVSLSRKCAAMRHHATQIWMGDGGVSAVNPHAAWGQVDESGRARGVWALSNLICQPVVPWEGYRVGTADRGCLQALKELVGLRECATEPGARPGLDSFRGEVAMSIAVSESIGE